MERWRPTTTNAVRKRFAMEKTTLYNGAPPAKRDLLARAHIAAMIDAARADRFDYDFNKLDNLDELFGPDELVAPVPAPAPLRRQRNRSLAKVCEAARKAGADRVIVDGVVIALSPAAAVPESDANEWDAVLPEDDHGPH